MFTLKNVKQIPLESTKPVDGIYPLQNDSNGVRFVMRQGLYLFGFKYDAASASWIKEWQEKVFNLEREYPLTRYPWAVANNLLPNQEKTIVLKHPDGGKFYSLNGNSGLKLLTNDYTFSDLKGNTRIGNFYPDMAYFGFMSVDSKGGARFYGVTEEKLKNSIETGSVPSLQLHQGEVLLNVTANSDILLTDKTGESPTDIALYNINGLEVYRFKEDYFPKKILVSSEIKKFADTDRIYFGNLTQQKFQDVLHLNASGLHLYQYNEASNTYEFLNKNLDFISENGWEAEYGDSIYLFDINSDGIDDLLFNGPQGLQVISYSANNEEWVPLLSEETGLLPSQRYTTAVGAIAPVTGVTSSTSLILQDTNGRVLSSELSSSEEIPTTTSNPVTTSTTTKDPLDVNGPTPEEIDWQYPKTKPHLRWSEQWNSQFIAKPVDLPSGFAKFVVPLFDTYATTGWNLRATMTYSSESLPSDLLGNGWSLLSQLNYVIVDYQGGIFPENAKYFLMINDNPKELKRISVNGGVSKFEFTEKKDNEENIAIEYDSTNEMWTIEGDTEIVKYGSIGGNGLLQKSLTWKHWRGVGQNASNMQEFIIAWHLGERIDKLRGGSLMYTYEQDTKSIDGKSYTSSIRLMSIKGGSDISVSLSYEKRTADEYEEINPVEEDGHITFPVALEQSHCVTAYSIVTPSYQQKFKFVYEVQGKERIMKSIYQIFPNMEQQILQFTYEKVLDSSLITQVLLVEQKVKVDIQHNTVNPPQAQISDKTFVEYTSTTAPQIAFGEDYSVLMYPNNDRVSFTIMNKPMSVFVTECGRVDMNCPNTEVGTELTEYKLHARKDSFVILLGSEKDYSLYVYKKTDDKWNREPTVIGFGKDAIVRSDFRSDTVVVAQPNSSTISIYQPDDETNDWTPKTVTMPISGTFTRVAFSGKLLVAHNDKQIAIAYEDIEKNWQSKVLNLDVTNLSFQETLSHFTITSDNKVKYEKKLNENGLQLNNNLIAMNAIKVANDKLTPGLRVIMLDRDHNIAQTKWYERNSENILDIRYDLEVYEDRLDIIKLGYVRDGSNYRVDVITFTGELYDEIQKIPNDNQREDAMNEVLKNLRESLKDQLADGFIVDLKLYAISVGSKTINWGNKTMLSYINEQWVPEELPAEQTVPLGDHFAIKTFSSDPLHLHFLQDGNVREDIKLDETGRFANRYPAYVAYQTDQNMTKVLTFKSESEMYEPITYKNHSLLLESDLQNLYTWDKTTNHLIKRPLATFVPLLPQSYVSSVSFTEESGVLRKHTYERGYQIDANPGDYAQGSKFIPGGNKSMYGSYELKQKFSQLTGKVEYTETWSNDKDEIVKTQVVPDQVKSSGSNTYANNSQILLDELERFVVSDFRPYSLADDMVSYYGFENYERNQIGWNTTERAWKMNDAEVVRGRFSFTGDSYLRLKGTSSYLEGEFTPYDQKLTYLAACWVRGHEINTSPEISAPFLRATIIAPDNHELVTLLARQRNHERNWSYLELPINMNQMHGIYERYLESIGQTVPEDVDEEKLRIMIRVAPAVLDKLDVDHIRFTPIGHEFQATVYDGETINPTEIIDNNGLISRIWYNKLQQEMAIISHSKNFERLTMSHSFGPSSVTNPEITRSSQVTFEPKSGFFEEFDDYSILLHWNVDDVLQWKVSSGQLWHPSSGTNKLVSKPGIFDQKNSAIRFEFSLENEQSSVKVTFKGVDVQITKENLIVRGTNRANVPSTFGDLTIMIDEDYLFVWLNSALVVDEKIPSVSSDSQLSLEVTNDTLIQRLFVMNQPLVSIGYQDGLSQVTQVIKLEDPEHAIVLETLYDELDRDAITTKPTRVTRTAGKSMLTYRPNFARNRYPTDQSSVWFTGNLLGEVNDLNPADEGYPYQRTLYAPDPVNRPKAMGAAGARYSVNGQFAIRYSDESGLALIHVLFPADQGNTQKVKIMPNGSLKVTVYNKQTLQVAQYVDVDGSDHILSTYEYDDLNHLVKILPPLYHQKVNTFISSGPYKPGEDHLTPEQRYWQDALAVRFEYDNYGHLIRRASSDLGSQYFLYTDQGTMRFAVQMNSNNDTEQINYYTYNANYDVIESGQITVPLTLEELQTQVNEEILPPHAVFQTVDFSNEDYDPTTRGRIRNLITHNGADRVIEKVSYNEKQEVSAKKTISEAFTDYLMTDMIKNYEGNQLTQLTYPTYSNKTEPLEVVYVYNRLRQLIGLGSYENPYLYGKFDYKADGKISTETFEKFTREYSYDSPGFLAEISDPFLKSTMTYVENGYGQTGFSDGIVMSIDNQANWFDTVDGRQFRVSETDFNYNFAKKCIRSLELLGYLNSQQQPIKMLMLSTEERLPLICRGRFGLQLAKVVGTKLRSSTYGHRYAYGNHQELIKAKFYETDTKDLINPMQPDAFAQSIPQLSSQDSKNIWDALTTHDYIFKDQIRFDPNSAQGRPGKDVYKRVEILDAIKEVNDRWMYYTNYIGDYLLNNYSKRGTVLVADFEQIFLWWDGAVEADLLTQNTIKQKAQQIYNKLVQIGFVTNAGQTSDKFLVDEFKSILSQYQTTLPEIVGTMNKYFNHAIGQASFDIESFNIDPNGNHEMYYTGFDRYKISYRNGTNQIESVQIGFKQIEVTEDGVVTIDPPKFRVEHDSRGNVVQAMHKNIMKISYHPVSQRTTHVVLADKREIFYYYDCKGERIMKRVFNAENQLTSETYYVRDEDGKVLTDRVTRYLPTKQETITNYIYGPRGLHGFVRDGSFYNVFTDHLGSVRLVINGDHVVAAYDYMPYGETLRAVESDPRARILYRYTGQEYDEETDLYNYHARFYDPSIGRFFQPDPKMQYFSPYKYAGNSPISFVDPDGQFAFLIAVIVGAIVGAYLGAAAANNRWNPLDWDWSDSGTWLGLIGGGIGGALLPFGIAGSIEVIGVAWTIALGAGGAYLVGAATNQNFDPSKWAWERPATWNGLFQGFSMGSGIVGGVAGVHEFASKFATLGKTIFLTVSYSTAGVVAYVSAAGANNWQWAFWQWEWNDPATYNALINGFTLGLSIPQGLTELGKGLSKLMKDPKKFLQIEGLTNKQAFKSILKNPQHPFYKTVGAIVIGYIMGAGATGEFDITKWNLASFSTYEGLLNGILSGKDLLILLRSAHTSQGSYTLSDTFQMSELPPAIWPAKYRNIVNDVTIVRRTSEFNGYMEGFFRGDSEIMTLIKNENYSPEVNQRIDEFFNAGMEDWMSSSNTMPKELEDLFYRETNNNMEGFNDVFNEFKMDGDIGIKERNEIILDEKPEYVGCSKARTFGQVCDLLGVGKPKQPEKKFTEDPKAFMTDFAISTFSLQPRYPIDVTGGPPKYKYVLESSGQGYKLQNVPESHTGGSFEGYFLQTSAKGNINDVGKILRIRPDGPINMIVTAELQGCSVCVKLTEQEMVLYHYYREPMQGIGINFPTGSTKPIFAGEDYFVTTDGKTIQELRGQKVLFDQDLNIINADHGVILYDPDQQIFIGSVNEATGQMEYTPITTINGKPISELQNFNAENRQKEQILHDNYFVVPYERYLGEPFNSFGPRQNTFVFATPIIYRDSTNRWIFQTQKLRYTPRASALPDFALVPNGLFQQPLLYRTINQRVRREIEYVNDTSPLPTMKPFVPMPLLATDPVSHLTADLEVTPILPFKHEEVFMNNENSNFNQTPPPASSSHPLLSAPSFTQGHFQGIMALLDVTLKKLTGRKPSNQTTPQHQLSWEEACIQATEIIDMLEENLKFAAYYSDISEDLIEFDSYELYELLTKKLTSGDLSAAQEILDEAVKNTTRSLFGEVSEEKVDEFMEQVNANPIDVFEYLMKPRDNAVGGKGCALNL